jgi:arsenate reductase
LITLYHNNSCSKSLCALTVLEENGQPYHIINYLETPPTAAELEEILKRLGMEAFDLVRKGEPVYRSLYEDKTLTNKEWIAIMVQNPILIERPIIITEKGAVIGRPAEKIYEVL